MVRSQQKPFTKRRVTHPRLPRGGFTSVARRTGGLPTQTSMPVLQKGFAHPNVPKRPKRCYCIILYFQRNLGGNWLRYDAWRWNKNFTKDDFSDVKSCFFTANSTPRSCGPQKSRSAESKPQIQSLCAKISDTPKLQWFWTSFSSFLIPTQPGVDRLV